MHSGKGTHVNVTVVFGPGGVSRKDPPVVKYSTVSNTDAPVAIGAAVERAPITDSLRPLAAALLASLVTHAWSLLSARMRTPLVRSSVRLRVNSRTFELEAIEQ